jgi:3-deoxy-D-manno-octulosonic-acid transferase
MTVYDLFWRAALPWLRRHHRLADGWPQRVMAASPPGPFDIWIQAASAGEAYLALQLAEALPGETGHRILMTTNTRQGNDILTQGIASAWPAGKREAIAAYCPLDRPRIMDRALTAFAPRLLILLETEIWPALLFHCARRRVPTLIVNGRLTHRSIAGYRKLPWLWRALAPTRVLAVSAADAGRFRQLFPEARVEVMPNMKFDRLGAAPADTRAAGALQGLFPPGRPLVVLGSVREEEEEPVSRLVERLHRARPDATIALFPRHLHRLAAWGRRLEAMGAAWTLRSRTSSPAAPGAVVLWDVFGELQQAYRLATTAFVGGSLAPLGGQNFLEALDGGVIPVIGPYWETFTWIGEAVFAGGLARRAADWESAAALLLKGLDGPPEREAVMRRARDYVDARRGGTRQAAQAAAALLGRVPGVECRFP